MSPSIPHSHSASNATEEAPLQTNGVERLNGNPTSNPRLPKEPKGVRKIPETEGGRGDEILTLEDARYQFEVSESDECSVDRDAWSNHREYLLSMIGFCVGIGNLWRFPYVCIRNGGGVFIIPFFFCLCFCAMPLFFMESYLGQFMQQGPIHVWRALCPIGKGIGMSMNMVCLLTGWYYTVLLAWSLIYTFHSFQSPLPWTLCNQTWNTANCVTPNSSVSNSSDAAVDAPAINGTAEPYYSSVFYVLGNSNASSSISNESLWSNFSSVLANVTSNTNTTTDAIEAAVAVKRSASEEFWLYKVLEISGGLEKMNGVPWHTALALFVATLVIFLGIAKGIKTSGKVVYVTATVPYILLTVLLIKGATLPGAYKGVIFYLTPDFNKLLHIQTWVEAALQVFFSLGVSYGSLITMASYNKFRNNCLRDAVFVSMTSECTSIYGGFAIFTVLGHMAHIYNQPVAHYARSGPGLAFVVYPEAIAQLPLPQLWGVLFFVMLFTLGLDSQFNVLETMMTDIVDLRPKLFARRRIALTAFVMLCVFLLSIPFAARGGVYLFQLIDWYIAAYTVVIVGFLECIIVGWIYGTDYFQNDLELMLGRKKPVVTYMWRYVTPALLTTVFVSIVMTYRPPTYEGYRYTAVGEVIGWFAASVSFVPIPVMAVHEIMKTKGGSLLERIRKSTRPTPAWRPADPESRTTFKRV